MLSHIFTNRLIYAIVLIFAVVVVNVDDISFWLNKNQLLDKTGHFIGFLLLSWLLDRLINIPRGVLVLSVIFYSGFTEICQWYLGFRSGQFDDFVANALGCSTYYLFATISAKYKKSP
ncbi:hypothetical protein E2K93_13275 [Thalassotalea sp. HSM 43]|uniref:VanZ family protein n=1 Tax=Thalassotalea sp. HSM 43 TaxID=2552945 RepID=UPI001081B03F|nr:VanZ family protein [Thalassotalea sp. HSM 43]QBY05287.1 hypothetical protein E2K93_13275 [Thalassotalea sp. HSM 43]